MESGHQRGLVWLLGMDANDGDPTAKERTMLEAMEGRRGKRLVITD